MTTTAVTVDDVRVTYGDLDVLRDVSLTVERGAVTCLIGPNGSGKTTLLRAIAGLEPVAAGTVNRSSTATRSVGYLAQEPAFRPQFSVRETLSFYADLVGAANEADPDVDAAVERAGLGGVADRRVEALSGGMTRLLGVAQATIGDPDLLVLDEPTSGLDPMMTRHVMDVVERLADGGRGLVLSTHDLLSVERVADRVILLDRGRVVATGTPADLLAEADADSIEDAMSALVEGELGAVATREGAAATSGGGEGAR
ncbi:MAG: ABC transporter ATP-binding protein [Haloarculaceae archaeon]